MKGKWYYYAIFVTFVVICGIIYVRHLSEAQVEVITDIYQNDQIEPTQGQASNDIGGQVADNEETKNHICVHISGAVVNEGVYVVEEGTRVYEVIELAGGLTDNASNVINQAKIVSDEEHIIIPTKEEVESGVYVSDEIKDNGLVNINTATVEKLMTLPGIGESKAKSIIKYRTQNGKFTSKEDIMNVNGIKQGLYDNIEDYITIK